MRGGRKVGRSHQRGRFARAQIQARCAQALVDVVVGTKGALNQAALLLALKVVFRTKPAFKDMAVLTLEIQYLHIKHRTPVSTIQ